MAQEPKQQPGMLDHEYLQSHLSQVHTHESWGSSVLAKALESAMETVGATGSVPSAEIDVPFTISPVEYQGRLCVQVCAFGICVHVG
ncbi:hypothetical protein COL35_29215 [Bacillus toyonensis]|uniref:hypothetical protein n=1 Tax=Bacillus toyonensis TaxID=155322 RepID=UPI000BF7B3BC|nr:hypothetical protein [Bacillus toyonensis]PFX63070.1 hypothetical protein COL35_29215 [Bacillus toyonensis]